MSDSYLHFNADVIQVDGDVSSESEEEREASSAFGVDGLVSSEGEGLPGSAIDSPSSPSPPEDAETSSGDLGANRANSPPPPVRNEVSGDFGTSRTSRTNSPPPPNDAEVSGINELENWGIDGDLSSSSEERREGLEDFGLDFSRDIGGTSQKRGKSYPAAINL